MLQSDKDFKVCQMEWIRVLNARTKRKMRISRTVLTMRVMRTILSQPACDGYSGALNSASCEAACELSSNGGSVSLLLQGKEREESMPPISPARSPLSLSLSLALSLSLSLWWAGSFLCSQSCYFRRSLQQHSRSLHHDVPRCQLVMH